MDINYDNICNINCVMNINDNFKIFGKVDITKILEQYKNISESDWDKFTWRQEANPMHGASKTLAIIYDQDFRHFNNTRQEFYEKLNFGEIIEPITKILEDEYGPGYIVRAVLVNLPSGKSIKPHVDIGGSYNLSHRIHIPLLCEEKSVEYVVENESRYFEIGEMFELNNMRNHSVYNRGNIDRINLLFDFATYTGEGWWWR